MVIHYSTADDHKVKAIKSFPWCDQMLLLCWSIAEIDKIAGCSEGDPMLDGTKNRPVMRNELKWNQMRWSIKNQWNFSIFSFRTRKKVVSENLSEFGEQLIARKRETTFSMQSYEKRSSEFPSRHSASDLTKRGIIDESFFSLVRVRARKCASVYVRANDSARERLRASRHARAAMCHLCASGVVRPGSRYFA